MAQSEQPAAEVNPPDATASAIFDPGVVALVQWALAISLAVALACMLAVLVRNVIVKFSPKAFSANQRRDREPHELIAYLVLGIGGGVVLLFVINTWEGDDNENRSTILALIGTWVGTVLAFYFGKQNFEAAARVQAGFNHRDNAKPVTEHMIDLAEIERFPIPAGQPVGDTAETISQRIKIGQLVEYFENSPYRRVPVLSDSGHFIYIIHSEPIARFIARRVRENKNAPANAGAQANANSDAVLEMKLNEAFGHSAGKKTKTGIGLKTQLESAAFVTERATMGEAKAAMSSGDHCQDVFVTKNGKRSGKVVGWLTNNVILDHTE